MISFRKVVLRWTLLLSSCALITYPHAAFGKNKVVICHVTAPGSEKFHTIEVAQSAVKAHLKHGDRIGDCCDHCEDLCDDQGSCEGCSDCPGWSICQADEPCCDPETMQFFPQGTVCDSFEEFQCTGPACGADAKRRVVSRQCSGDAGDCPEDRVESAWETVDCGLNQVCQTDQMTFAHCTTCAHGCGSGACFPECNPSDGAACCAVDGSYFTGCLHLTKSGHGLDWQNPHDGSSRSFGAAQADCAALALGGHSNWRVPSIGELRTLVQGCSDIESAGACQVDDDCSAQTCHQPGYCTNCIGTNAPGSGCFWSEAIEAFGCGTFWSATTLSDDPTQAWLVNFTTGDITSFLLEFEYQVRCVRTVE